MNHSYQTLLYLKKHYAPFNQFNFDMLDKVQEGIRLFRLLSGEQITIKTYANRDFIYVTDGSITIHQKNKPVHNQQIMTINAHHINNKPIAFGVKDGYLVIIAMTNTTVVHADMNFIDSMIPFKIFSEIAPTNNSHYFKRLLCLRRSNLCNTLTINVLQDLAQQFKEIKVRKGLRVITQNQKAQFFYIIMDGEAEVLQKTNNDDEKVIARLHSGCSFGEQALITEENRTASIRMIRDGTLLKLSKQHFDNLVSNSIICQVNAKVAKAMMQSGSKLIDVRITEEYNNQFILDAILVPLPKLRKYIARLNKKSNYLIICSSGLYSTAAAVILKQYGIKSHVIIGGINQWPF